MLKQTMPRIGVDFHVFDGKFQGSRSHLIGIFGELTKLCPEFRFVFLLEKVGTNLVLCPALPNRTSSGSSCHMQIPC